MLYDYVYVYDIGIPFDVAIAASMLTHLEPSQCPRKLFGMSAVIGIRSLAMFNVSDFIQLTVSDLI